MRSKQKMITLTVSAMLTLVLAGYADKNYAKDNKSDSSKSDSSKSDSNKRSDSNSGDKSKQKLTICHVPSGKPADKHTIHIAFSAWPAHRDKHGGDWLGSCNNPPKTPDTSTTTSTTKETLHSVSGCSDTVREQLITKVQSYYEPVTVADTILDDETVVTAMSQCLDRGDSSDSNKSGSDSSKSKDSKGRSTGGKGQGHDSVSDSGKHHRIRGCQNKDSSHHADSSDSSKKGKRSDSDKDDSNKNYHKKLKSACSVRNAAKGIKDPIVVSDSSLEDKNVWKEFNKCAADSSDSNKISSKRCSKKKGDSGHKQQILKDCKNDSSLRTVIKEHKEAAKTSKGEIVLTETIYNDESVKSLVAQCTKDNPVSIGGESGPTNWREINAPNAVADPAKDAKAAARKLLNQGNGL